MKRFVITAAVLVVTFVALWIDVLPVRCSQCDRVHFRTDIMTMLCGGYGEVWDLHAPVVQTSTAIAGENLETQADATVGESPS